MGKKWAKMLGLGYASAPYVRVVSWLAPPMQTTRELRVRFWSEAGPSPNHDVNGRDTHLSFERKVHIDIAAV